MGLPKYNLQNIPLSKISRTYFRIVSAKRENEILNTKGSFTYGGRYNPAGEFAGLYLSENLEVCFKERERKAKKDALLAQTVGKVKVSLNKVLDLTDSQTLKKLNIREEDLKKEQGKDGWIVTWEIARLAYESGIEAILAPSVTNKGNNLIVFDKYINNNTIRLLSKFKD